MILSIALMLVDRYTVHISSIRQLMSIPLWSMQAIIVVPGQWASYTRSFFDDRTSLLSENERLRAAMLFQRADLQRLVAIEAENASLKALFHASKRIKNRMLIAELLSVDSEPFIHQVLVNKGKRDGVFLGQPVLDAYGVMGQIVEVGYSTSRLLLINDKQSGISLQNIRNGMRATAMGDGYSGRITLLYVPKTADVHVGDTFVTSGLSSRYPEGYPVGKVVSVDRDPAGQFASIYLHPSAHLDSSRYVLLVRTAKNA